MVEVELSDFGSGYLLSAGKKDRRAGATMIDDGKDGVVSVGLGETDNEVHGYLLKREGRGVCRNLVHRWASAMGDDFVLLTSCASLDVLGDPRAHVWPPVTPLSLGDGFVMTWVSSDEAFVHYSHDLTFDRKV